MIGASKSMVPGNAEPLRIAGDASWYGTLWMVAACLGVLATLFFSGCSGSQAQPVNPSIARESLRIALDHWKNGDDPKLLKLSATPMTAQDYEWNSGAKLLDYEILGDGKQVDANLHIEVKLKLVPQGKSKAVEKTASYVVGTSPSVTVFRDVMRH
jgi:hypothetical protein